ncbi:MAG: ATP-binding cassette domain-containing protein [Alphaproteobacteria bacterium]|nr:ATP-binding cassette domain-containing protein [Alphaproteobacteria bacterium]NNF24941.1 ATP-binding cassette domain-containing protein [Paracoccaceae bacterium]
MVVAASLSAPRHHFGLRHAVVRRRGSTLLGPVTLALPPVGLTIVLGPNGAGKTTMLRAMHGLDRLSEGEVLSDEPLQAARRKQGFVFQSPIMLRRSVRANLAYPLKLDRVPSGQAAEAVERWAKRTGLTAVIDNPAPSLSGGEKQKLALARALIRKPELVFLDEPCANLDGRSTREIEELLSEAVEDGTRIVMTTHNIAQARRLATDAVFLFQGLIHEQGPADRFFDQPQRPETQGFLKGDLIE